MGLSQLYPKGKIRFSNLLEQTKSEKMTTILRRAINYAKLSEPVLIYGPTGVGKNMIAQAMHNENISNDKFLEVTCSGFSDTLFESEAFGHVKGAFTGAIKTKKGQISFADGGTLFLDEIGDTTLRSQSKLLRLIESGDYCPLGSEKYHTVNSRIICATNKSREELFDPAIFRKDLFYRIKYRLCIPPLCDRVEDIQYLMEHFLKEYSQNKLIIEDRAQRVLDEYPWPGNIREMKYAIKGATELASIEGSSEIKLCHLPEEIIEYTSEHSDHSDHLDLSLEYVEIKHILYVLETSSNKSQAIKKLEISENTINKKLSDCFFGTRANEKLKAQIKPFLAKKDKKRIDV